MATDTEHTRTPDILARFTAAVLAECDDGLDYALGDLGVAAVRFARKRCDCRRRAFLLATQSLIAAARKVAGVFGREAVSGWRRALPVPHERLLCEARRAVAASAKARDHAERVAATEALLDAALRFYVAWGAA